MVSVHNGESRSMAGQALWAPAGLAAPLPSDHEHQAGFHYLPMTHGEALGTKTATVSVSAQSYELILVQPC